MNQSKLEKPPDRALEGDRLEAILMALKKKQQET